MSVLLALVVLYFLPTIIRGFALGLLIVLAVVAVAHAQQTRTTCYDSGNTRICETFDGMGNIIAKSHCYQSGRDTRCETQNFGGQAMPSGNGPNAGWRYSPPNGDRPQR